MHQLLFDNYIQCLEKRGSVAVGNGATLYLFVRSKLENSMFKLPQEVRLLVEKHASVLSWKHDQTSS